MSVHKEGNIWYFVVTHGIKANGKPKQYKRRGFKNEKEAKKAETKFLYELQSGDFVEPSKAQYKDLLERWLDKKKREVQTTTFMNYETNVRTHIIPALGKTPLYKIKAIMIEDFYYKLYDESNLSPTTVQKIHTIIKDSLKYAVKRELLAKNPVDSVDRPKQEKREVSVWGIDELKRFLSVAKADPMYIAFHLAIMTGMRLGEILGLRWMDIDFSEKRISIQQTLGNDGSLKAGAKNKSSVRVVEVAEETIEELLARKRSVELEKSKANEMYVDNDLVVCTKMGTPLSPSNLRRTFNRLIKNAGLKRIRFHDLRHSHATVLLTLNVNPKIAQERLGHSNIRMTLDTYSHVLPSMQREAVDKFTHAIFD